MAIQPKITGSQYTDVLSSCHKIGHCISKCNDNQLIFIILCNGRIENLNFETKYICSSTKPKVRFSLLCTSLRKQALKLLLSPELWEGVKIKAYQKTHLH